MLIIRRRAGEAVLVGEEVEIAVVEVSGGCVKLGISAPREVLILRKEIRLAAEENRVASRGITAASLASLVSGLRKREAENLKKTPASPIRQS